MAILISYKTDAIVIAGPILNILCFILIVILF